MLRRTFVFTAAALAAAPPAFAQVQAGDDHTIGTASAPLQLIEYASATCGHCAHFHETNWSTLKTSYIDTGRVRFTLRELYTPPAPVSLAMFQLARCGNASDQEYIRRVGVMFERQQQLLGSGTGQGIRDALLALAREWAITEEQALAAIGDQTSVARAQRAITAADAHGVTRTPSFILNGTLVTDDAFLTLAGMTQILDTQLAAGR
jgi:protein-disulfide isomerase